MTGTRRKPAVLGPFIQDFQAHVLSLGYTPGSTRGMLKVVGQLGRWLADQHLQVADFSEALIEPFIHDRKAAGYRQVQHRRVFMLLLNFLRDQGAVPAIVDIPSSELDIFMELYRNWLVNTRGLAATTVLRYVNLARRFLTEPGSSGLSMINLQALRGGDVSDFLMAEVSRVSLGAARGRVAELRSLLRYLQSQDLVQGDLAASVPSVAGWHAAGLPDSLSAADVQKLLDSCDGTRKSDPRDGAILALLARLGLRSVEVAGLLLDDIDWSAGEIWVRGKGRRGDRLPLPTDVGEALVQYVMHHRPTTDARQVFFTERAPRKPIAPDLVSDVVRRACRRSGLAVVGAHQLRHALATDLLAHDVSLLEISQVLRHRDLATTAVYAKVDLLSLRSVAAQWPGDQR